jgi:hypothetical protein
MKPVYRIAVASGSIAVERWAEWAAFDAALPPRSAGRADLAYAAGPLFGLDRSAEGVFELQRLRVNNGRMADVAGFLPADLSAWRGAGATALGAFTIVHGDDLPACLLLLRWPSLAAALSGQAAFEADAAATEARRITREARGQAAIRNSERVFRTRLVVETTG